MELKSVLRASRKSHLPVDGHLQRPTNIVNGCIGTRASARKYETFGIDHRLQLVHEKANYLRFSCVDGTNEVQRSAVNGLLETFLLSEAGARRLVGRKFAALPC